MWQAREWMLVGIAIGAALVFSGCGKAGGAQSVADAAQPGSAQTAVASTSGKGEGESAADDPIVVLHTSQGDVTIKLFAEKAPRTVENFLRGYAERGFYDQTIFHHVESGKMLIAGGYAADWQRKPVRAPIYNESRNGLSNRRGTVAMIREADAPHSATSEFFINLADNTELDYEESDDGGTAGYCVFGEIIKGLEVADRIAQLPTAAQGNFPSVPSPVVTILSIQRMQ